MHCRTYLLTVGISESMKSALRNPGARGTYSIVQSSSGGTVASLWTASQAKSRSKSVKPFKTASAMSESACVPTYEPIRTGEPLFSPNNLAARTMMFVSISLSTLSGDIYIVNLNVHTYDIFPHRKPATLDVPCSC